MDLLVWAVIGVLCAPLGMGLAASMLEGREKRNYALWLFVAFSAYKFASVVAVAVLTGMNRYLTAALLGGICGMALYALKCIYREDVNRWKARFIMKEVRTRADA